MKTIKEWNEEAEEAGVEMYVIKIEPKWRPYGIMCPCGCKEELLKLYPQEPDSTKHRIKCQETEKTGWLILDGTPRGIVKGIEWD